MCESNTALPLHRRQTCARTHNIFSCKKRRERNTPIRRNRTGMRALTYADFNCVVVYAHCALLISELSGIHFIALLGAKERAFCRCAILGLWASLKGHTRKASRCELLFGGQSWFRNVPVSLLIGSQNGWVHSTRPCCCLSARRVTKCYKLGILFCFELI
jgi:hypothetical protein